MEALYVKLYDKYANLKREKESELEKLNHDQEVKFMNYSSAADEMIELLKGENDRLHTQINELRHEVASVRSSKDEQHAQYQKLLTEENHKNKELSEEIERLHNLQRGICRSARNDIPKTAQLNTPGGPQVGKDASDGLSIKTRKRCRSSEAQTDGTKRSRHSGIETDVMITTSTNDELSKQKLSSGTVLNNHLLECCGKMIDDSGGDINFSGSIKCMFHVLVECLIGMKFSTVTRKDEISILGRHQSSGYSFSLTLVKKSFREAEFLYNVSSLGTFERVAPEWMREEVMFSMSMCPIFFERVVRVIKLCN